MQIHGYSQLTLLDFPGRIGCTIFTGSCNLRCPFCHNSSLVLHPDCQPALDEAKILAHIESRKTKLEGVCVTGGEPTLQHDLPRFLTALRQTGLLIKLDTNGTNPAMLELILKDRLVDFVAMDIKAMPSNYARATGMKVFDMDKIFQSVDLITNGNIDYEFRTTVVDGIHTADDFTGIGKWLRGAKAYYLQQYKDSGDLIAPAGLDAPSPETLQQYREILLPYIPSTFIRGTQS